MTHQKRLSAPRIYPIQRKNNTFVSTSIGPHAKDTSLPLVVVMRDVLQVAETAKEVRKIIHNGDVLVDGRVPPNPRFAIGFMDVISLPKLGESYRFLITENGAELREVQAEEDAERKICRITGKTSLKNGETQIGLHDGKTLVYNEDCACRGSIVLAVPNHTVESYLPFTEGAAAYITNGKHRGEHATIKNIRTVTGSRPNVVVLEDSNGEEFETVEDYVFVIGEDEPVIHV